MPILPGVKWPGRGPQKRSSGKPIEVDPRRYEGKPLLVLLDNYVLSVIGALEPEREAQVADAVRRGFGGGDDWRATLLEQIELNRDYDAEVLGLWTRRPPGLEPIEFMIGFSDANFVPYLDKR